MPELGAMYGQDPDKKRCGSCSKETITMSLNLKNNPLTNFSRGFFYPFRAGKFIKNHPALLRYIIIPFLINFVILSLAVYWGLSFFNSIV